MLFAGLFVVHLHSVVVLGKQRGYKRNFRDLLRGLPVTGWATFVAPGWSQDLLSARPADLNFRRLDNDSDYVGQIRL
jgi:hypothetical protein